MRALLFMPLLIWVAAAAATAAAADLKDPTPPALPPPVAAHAPDHPPPPKVSAIFFSGVRRIAIFNEQPVHAGDVVGTYQIDEVTVDGVRYTSGGHSAFAPLAVRR
jgi:hypothetical protein